MVGLGPGSIDLITERTRAEIEIERPRFLRTRRHESATLLDAATDFDSEYETSSDFDTVYRRIVDRLLDAARTHGDVLYAVPGSPLVAEQTVRMLIEHGGDDLSVEMVPALSFGDLAWTALAVDPLETGATIVDGRRFAEETAGRRGPFLVGQCDQRHVLSDIKLTHDDGPTVTVLQRLGTPEQDLFEVDWHELDRSFEPDHLTSLWIPQLPRDAASAMSSFEQLARRLRQDCPWSSEQTHESLRPYVTEEAGEVVDAINTLSHAATVSDDELEDAIVEFRDELGDLLYQVVIHSTLAEEAGWFDLAEVIGSIHDKLVRRHPHVFGDATAVTAADAIRLWAEVKTNERRAGGR